MYELAWVGSSSQSTVAVSRAARAADTSRLPARRPPTLAETGPYQDTLPLRPRHRRPPASLCILDDPAGCTGEWVRLRTDRFVIGCTEGDLRIAHDPLLSSPHAALTCETEAGRSRWYVSDLQSTTGTFVRVRKAKLHHGDELLLGERRYRFNAPPSPSASYFPALVEITPDGDGPCFELIRREGWIGRNPQLCAVLLDDDPYVSPQHARIERNHKGRWKIEDCRSLNGTWLRIERVPVDQIGVFRLGDQYFLLKVD